MNAKIISTHLKWFLTLTVVLALNHTLFTFELHVITDPKPTTTEKKILLLEEVQTIGENLGNNQYMFSPMSVTVDKSNLFVYDKSQAKVFRFSLDLKLSGTFGRKGQGPCEFFGTGMRGHVFINIGRDGNLYANDIHARRWLVFDRMGKPIKTVRYGNSFYVHKPVGDKNGNILSVSMKDGNIQVKNEKGEVLGQCKSESLHYSFLFEDPGKLYRQAFDRDSFAPEAHWQLTIDGKLLVYFAGASCLTVFNGRGNRYEYEKTIKLWPKQALIIYKERYRREKEENKARSVGKKYSLRSNFFMSMFGRLIIDRDNKDVFYLQQGVDRVEQKVSAIVYAFNVSGQLLRVVRIPMNPNQEEPSPINIDAKINNIFYGTRSTGEVVLFKEKKK